ncbi:hypothetical protein [Silvanigrella aquatica]|uniref:Uncharacterized protein n=1 Tax=Silvanigrella aquatica TaxID=1915309 RepID=A0A1L4CX11_9BACT|nr:hypothetical protein [Silvanigrella aquatica]APJ02476.1 hypothetical protein AXG55_00415 [Silvanigrella aquatica]
MRVNVFSPLSYTWERFAELQHQYAMARRRRDDRHFDKLVETREHDRINEYMVNKDIMYRKALDKKIKDKMAFKEVLKKAHEKELNRISFERDYLDNLFLIGLKIKEHVKYLNYLRKASFDKYLLELETERALHYKNDLLYKHEFKKIDRKRRNNEKI